MGKLFFPWALALAVCLPLDSFGFELTGEKAQFVSRTHVVAPNPSATLYWSEDQGTGIAVDRAGNLYEESESLVPSGNQNTTEEFQGTLPNSPHAWTVHGKDERTRVASTKSFPYRTMGMLSNGCTGTLIGPRHVLTAGHCVYDTDTDRWEKNLDFYPGRNGFSKPYGRYEWDTAVTVSGYTTSHLKIHDYALVILKQRAGDDLGWMGYGFEPKLGTSTNVNINGYPDDKSYGTLWHSYCGLRSTSRYWLTYYCDTEGGMSGSGVYTYIQGKRTINAVHTYGGSWYNSGTRITSSKFDKLKAWKAKYR